MKKHVFIDNLVHSMAQYGELLNCVGMKDAFEQYGQMLSHYGPM